MKPLDWHVDARTGLVLAARLFSNLVSPPVMFAVLGLAFAWRSLPFWPGLAWAATYGLLVSLAPILVVLYLLRTGRIAELHMTNTSERHLPYLASVLFAGITLALLRLLQGPALLQCLVIFNLIELVTLALINIFWLISIHSTAMTATLILAWLVFGGSTLAITAPLLGLIATVRVYLKRHTVTQVVAGILLGTVTILALLPFGCFS